MKGDTRSLDDGIYTAVVHVVHHSQRRIDDDELIDDDDRHGGLGAPFGVVSMFVSWHLFCIRCASGAALTYFDGLWHETCRNYKRVSLGVQDFFDNGFCLKFVGTFRIRRCIYTKLR